MSSNFKSVAPAHTDPVRAAGLYRLAIVGAGTLKGKEVAEVLGDRNFPSLDIKLLDDNDSLGKLETVGDEVSFIQSVRAEQFEKVDFTFFACDQECTRQNWKKAQAAGFPCAGRSTSDARRRRKIRRAAQSETIPTPSRSESPQTALQKVLPTGRAGGSGNQCP